MTTRWARRALRDVLRLHRHINREDPVAAARIVARIGAAADSLVAFPASGRGGRVFGTRELVVPSTPYLLIYRVRGEVIQIVRVLHGAQRWPPE